MTSEAENFQEDLISSPREENEQLKVYVGGFEGPIDLLLSLARDQKVDLTKISILALADQYLAFIEQVHKVRLELAADYLVMAAWLAYLKSRLLIPEDEQPKNEPTATELAEALAFQLRRLEAMRGVAEQLLARPQLGVNIFGRGEPEGLPVEYKSTYDLTLYEVLKAYGDIERRKEYSVYKLEPVKLITLEEAIERLSAMLGKIAGDWLTLRSFLPSYFESKLMARSALAAHFGASLELAKRGIVQIRQEALFAPIYVRKFQGDPGLPANDTPANDESNKLNDQE